MNLKNATVDGRLVEVLTEDEYSNKWRMYASNPNMYNDTALEVTGPDGGTYILPFRNKLDDRPGIYNYGCMYYTRLPKDDEKDAYLEDNLSVVDYSDISNVKEFLSKNAQVRNMENIILTDVDSVFALNLTYRTVTDHLEKQRAFLVRTHGRPEFKFY